MIYKPGDLVEIHGVHLKHGKIALVISMYETSAHPDGFVYNLLLDTEKFAPYWADYIRPFDFRWRRMIKVGSIAYSYYTTYDSASQTYICKNDIFLVLEENIYSQFRVLHQSGMQMLIHRSHITRKLREN